MHYRILVGGDLHKRMKDLTTIRGYVNAGHQADYVVLHYSWLYGYLLTIYRGADM